MKHTILSRGFVGLTVLLMAAAASGDYLSNQKAYYPPNYSSMRPPEVGGAYEDPVFGTVIHRLTDALAGSADFLTPEYASSDVFNADESMVRIHGDQTSFYSTTPPFALLRRRSLGAGSPSDYWWHASDPNILYRRSYPNSIRAYHFDTDRDSLQTRFTQYSTVKSLGESNLSLDGDRLALVGDDRFVFIYEFSTDSIVATVDTNAAPMNGKSISDITVTPSGNGVIIGWNAPSGFSRAQGFEYFEIQGSSLVFQRQLWDRGGHHDVGQSTNGTDYLIHVGTSGPLKHVFATRIIDGHSTPMGTFGGEGFWHGILLSANSMHNDNYFYAQMYRTTEVAPSEWIKPWINEIIRVPMGGGPIERIAHHRTRPYGNYFWTPRGSVSRSGQFFVYPSNFNRQALEGGIPANYVDSYLIDLDQADEGTPSDYRLTVAKTGDGKGLVTSTLPGIHCGTDCTERYAAFSVVTLTASADPSSEFVGWSGGAECTEDALLMTRDLICVAQFDLLPEDARGGGGDDREPPDDPIW